MTDRIDRSSPVPLYHQLERVLRGEIERGTYQVGDLLPSEAEICQRYDVSRSVVRQTLANLASAGLVRTERGRGTFVAEAKLHERFVQRTTGFYEDLTRMGLEVRTKVLRQEVVELPLQVQEFLGVRHGVRIDRLRSVEGRVLAYVTTYLPPERCPGIEEQDLNDRSLYAHLAAEYGLKVASGTRTVEAVAAQGEVAAYLEVSEGTPLLLLRSASRDASAEPLEWFEAWHRADRTMFEIEIIPGETERPFHGILVDHPSRSIERHARGSRWEALMAGVKGDPRIIAVLRASRVNRPLELVEGLARGGVAVIEFTLTAENALDAIREVRDTEGVVVGAGSVLDAEAAHAAIDAGARFLVSPVGMPEVVEAAGDVPVILAGYTPGEVWMSWRTTGEPVKLFPASVGGPAYLRSLRDPMPQVPLIPAGGVDSANAADYLQAGAVAVFVGGWLCPPAALVQGDGRELERRAIDLVRRLRAGT